MEESEDSDTEMMSKGYKDDTQYLNHRQQNNLLYKIDGRFVAQNQMFGGQNSQIIS